MQRTEYQGKMTASDELLEQAPGNSPGDTISEGAKAISTA
jgi:hypothetical protein